MWTGPKSFVPVTRNGVFIQENFHPGYHELEISVSASYMNKRFLRREEWRGEISEVDRTYMKRPLKVIFIKVVKSVDILLTL